MGRALIYLAWDAGATPQVSRSVCFGMWAACSIHRSVRIFRRFSVVHPPLRSAHTSLFEIVRRAGRLQGAPRGRCGKITFKFPNTHCRRGDTIYAQGCHCWRHRYCWAAICPGIAAAPWFRIEALAASRRSAGHTYGEALRDPATGALRWYAGLLPDKTIFDLPVEDAETLEASRFNVIFTGIESDAAQALEPQYAKSCPVLSTASAFRYEDDVPVLIPGVNDDHARLVEQQRRQRGWKGFISPNPNCTTVGLAISLAPLVRTFGVDTVVMTSLQAVSGAGRNGGVLSLDIIDNVIPYIPKEEDKVRREVCKILGQVTTAGLEPLPMRISATCTRVPVMDGHTASVLAVTSRQASVSEAREAMESFGRSLWSWACRRPHASSS